MILVEALHQAALVPLLAMLVLGRRLPASYWLVAGAFAISWMADSIAHYTHTPLAGVVWWPYLQFALIVAAFSGGEVRAAWIAALGALALASSLGLQPPYLLYTVAGSVAVLMVARGPLVVPLAVYFGAGTAAFALMVTSTPFSPPAWYTYQGCRVIAFGAFVGAILHRRSTRDGHTDRNSARPRGGAGAAA